MKTVPENIYVDADGVLSTTAGEGKTLKYPCGVGVTDATYEAIGLGRVAKEASAPAAPVELQRASIVTRVKPTAPTPPTAPTAPVKAPVRETIVAREPEAEPTKSE